MNGLYRAPRQTVAGALIIAAGIPVYAALRRRKIPNPKSQNPNPNPDP